MEAFQVCTLEDFVINLSIFLQFKEKFMNSLTQFFKNIITLRSSVSLVQQRLTLVFSGGSLLWRYLSDGKALEEGGCWGILLGWWSECAHGGRLCWTLSTLGSSIHAAAFITGVS